MNKKTYRECRAKVRGDVKQGRSWAQAHMSLQVIKQASDLIDALQERHPELAQDKDLWNELCNCYDMLQSRLQSKETS